MFRYLLILLGFRGDWRAITDPVSADRRFSCFVHRQGIYGPANENRVEILKADPGFLFPKTNWILCR